MRFAVDTPSVFGYNRSDLYKIKPEKGVKIHEKNE